MKPNERGKKNGRKERSQKIHGKAGGKEEPAGRRKGYTQTEMKVVKG